jgi:hypothetical protein
MSKDGMFGAKKGPETQNETYSQRMTPTQDKYFNQALDLYGGSLGENNVYSGQRVADLSPSQKSVFDFANTGGFVTTPQETTDYYNSTIKNPTLKNLNESVIPATKEAFSGPGYWGSGRASAEAKATQDTYDVLNTKWGDLNWQVKQDNMNNQAKALSVGQAEQEYNQNVINADMQKFAEQNQITDPTNLSVLMSLLGLTSGTSNLQIGSTTTPSWKTGDWMEFGAKVGAAML